MSTESVTRLSDPVPTEETKVSGSLIAGIMLLVLSILVFLVGFCLLIPGIVQATPLLMVTGAGLIGVGFLGLLIAGIFTGREWHKDNRLLSWENEKLRVGIGSANRWSERTNEEVLESKKLLLDKEQKITELETILLGKQEALESITSQLQEVCHVSQDLGEAVKLLTKDLETF